MATGGLFEQVWIFGFVAQLAVLLVAARLLGKVFLRLGQPRVVGELAAGILLGPSVLGVVLPSLQLLAFPGGETRVGQALGVFSWVAIVLLLAVTGMRMDTRALKRARRSVATISLVDLSISLTIGAAVGFLLSSSATLNGAHPDRYAFVAFLGVMLAISAVPVLASVLRDLDLLSSNLGTTMLSSAVATDAVGWVLLAAASGLAAGSAGGGPYLSFGGTVLFVLLAYVFGRPAVESLTALVPRTRVALATAVCLAIPSGLAAVTQLVGTHAVLGAFVGGLLVGRSPHVGERVKRRLEGAVVGFVAPIFFASSGLKVDIAELAKPSLAAVGLLVLVAAIASKLIGGTLGARLAGIPPWQALAVGCGLNARGSMEVAAATLALSLGVISGQLFSVVVVMAMVTSMMAPPLLRWTLRRSERAGEPGARVVLKDGRRTV